MTMPMSYYPMRGARGLLWSSRVALGCSNGIRWRVFVERGGLAWFQEKPNELEFYPLVRPYADDKARSRRSQYGGQSADARVIQPPRRLSGGICQSLSRDSLRRFAPSVYGGLKGVAFVDAVVDSAQAEVPSWLTP